MIDTFQIKGLKLPQMLLFDSLRLYAQFLTTSVDLALLPFNGAQLERERTIPLDIQLKIPSSRHHFLLVLEVIILNMQIPPVSIPVDLTLMRQWNKYEFAFQTEMGTVEAQINLIEEIYLPK